MVDRLKVGSYGGSSFLDVEADRVVAHPVFVFELEDLELFRGEYVLGELPDLGADGVLGHPNSMSAVVSSVASATGGPSRKGGGLADPPKPAWLTAKPDPSAVCGGCGGGGSFLAW